MSAQSFVFGVMTMMWANTSLWRLGMAAALILAGCERGVEECHVRLVLLAEDVEDATAAVDGRSLGTLPIVNKCLSRREHTLSVSGRGQVDRSFRLKDREGTYFLLITRGSWTSAGLDWEPTKSGVNVERAPDGKVIIAATYTDDVLDGPWAHYFYPSGRLKERGSYSAGRRHGEWTGWYETGAKRYEGAFLNGAAHGAWSYWCPDGRVWAQALFDDGLRVAPPGTPDGPVTLRFADGSPSVSGSFKDGKADGKWTLWGCDGTKERESTYSAGVRTRAVDAPD